MPPNHHYTIGWICPLPLEMEAARLVLEDEHQVRYQQAYYTGGRIGQHLVLMGVQSQIGLNAASALAARMAAGFPNIRYFILVGIAGGVPRYGRAGAASEIVLGDVCVSSPYGNYGGVIQYDRGAWENQGVLNYRGWMPGVPPNLMVAVNNLRAQGREYPNIAQVLMHMRSRLDVGLQYQYNDPGPDTDRLFVDDYPHQGGVEEDCSISCNEESMTRRDARGHAAWRVLDTPYVHFGNIASSNQLQISAPERNRIQREHGVICFEMEAAGVMQEHPCVVVRGICDYADSHKNNGWQRYAAATAAAYAKVLLLYLPAY